MKLLLAFFAAAGTFAAEIPRVNPPNAPVPITSDQAGVFEKAALHQQIAALQNELSQAYNRIAALETCGANGIPMAECSINLQAGIVMRSVKAPATIGALAEPPRKEEPTQAKK